MLIVSFLGRRENCLYLSSALGTRFFENDFLLGWVDSRSYMDFFFFNVLLLLLLLLFLQHPQL